MDIGLLHIRLLLDAEADLQVAALIVSAVAISAVSTIRNFADCDKGVTDEQLTSSLNSPWCCDERVVSVRNY